MISRLSLVPVLAALVLILALPAIAHAGGTVELSADSTTLSFSDSGGSDNHLAVEFDAFVYTITDDNTSISAGSGCNQVASNHVTCPTVATVWLELDMGNGLDSLDVGPGSMIPGHVEIEVENVGDLTGGDANLDATITDSSGPTDAVTVTGSSGYDVIEIVDVRYHVDAGGKDDQIVIRNDFVDAGLESTVTATGGPGNDFIDASDSSANLNYIASEGVDVVSSGDGNDEITFGQGQDLIFGNGGDDRFYDVHEYEDGSDLSEIWGGPGNDTFLEMTPAHAEVTHFEGGPGIDGVSYQNVGSGPKPVNVNFDAIADDGAVQFGGGAEGDHYHVSVENIGGNMLITSSMQMRSNDTLHGSERPNAIFGHNGNDEILGFGGNDELNGGGGVDHLDGGGGDDALYTRDTVADVVICGSGDDIATVDALDEVSGDCETVELP